MLTIETRGASDVAKRAHQSVGQVSAGGDAYQMKLFESARIAASWQQH
jgi:hypothetical protein